MNLKNVVLSLVMLCFAFIGFSIPAFAEGDSNPIDKAFAVNFEKNCNSTYEQRFVYSEYSDAWKAELNNAIEWRKNQLPFKEDKDLMEKFKKSVFDQADLAGSIELQRWSDVTVEPGKRPGTIGTGGAGALIMTQASFYKQAVLFLIKDYVESEGPYKYKYSGKGADLKKLDR